MMGAAGTGRARRGAQAERAAPDLAEADLTTNPHPPRQIKLRIMLRIKIRARGFWRAFGLGACSTAGGGRPGARMAPPQAHVSPPTRPEPPVQLVRSRFAGFSKIDPLHRLKVG